MSRKSKKLWPTPNTMDGLTPRENKALRVWNNERDGRKNRMALSNLREAIEDSYYKGELREIPSLQPSLLPQDSLVSLLVLPGSEEAIRMTVTSGLKLSQLLKPSNPSGYCLKMLLESSTWHSTLCYLTWKVRATPMKRLLFQLAPSTPHTDEIESGLLPTPQTMDAIEMTREVTMRGKSPRIKSNQGVDGQAGLRDIVQMWPTPQTGAHNEAAHNAMSGDFKVKFCERAGIPTTGQLNPNWVEWLMGFPVGWTDLNARNAIVPQVAYQIIKVIKENDMELI